MTADQKALKPARVRKLEQVQKRVKEQAVGRKDVVRDPVVGVVPLNPGYFVMERLRAGPAVKARAVVRKKVQGR